ncbi:hypothetical protein GCM10017559_83930 [Streptosporangium longisporum]|uniref:Uncharacterized protein n=1 Tax=Streptosporangium longisporum TaxID=46187 RepID=A0ABP6LKE2_9ACTN
MRDARGRAPGAGERARGGAGGATGWPCPAGIRGQRQESLRVAVPPDGVVKERLGSLSQITEPSEFFLMYL